MCVCVCVFVWVYVCAYRSVTQHVDYEWIMAEAFDVVKPVKRLCKAMDIDRHRPAAAWQNTVWKHSTKKASMTMKTPTKMALSTRARAKTTIQKKVEKKMIFVKWNQNLCWCAELRFVRCEKAAEIYIDFNSTVYVPEKKCRASSRMVNSDWTERTTRFSCSRLRLKGFCSKTWI